LSLLFDIIEGYAVVLKYSFELIMLLLVYKVINFA